MFKVGTVSEELAKQLRIKGKPKCPFCHIPLTYVYEGAYGFTNEKCDQCRNAFLVNTDTLEVKMFTKAM